MNEPTRAPLPQRVRAAVDTWSGVSPVLTFRVANATAPAPRRPTERPSGRFTWLPTVPISHQRQRTRELLARIIPAALLSASINTLRIEHVRLFVAFSSSTFWLPRETFRLNSFLPLAWGESQLDCAVIWQGFRSSSNYFLPLVMHFSHKPRIRLYGIDTML